MRGKPGKTERVVGVFVLGLTGVIVCLFLLTGGLLADTVERISPLRTVRHWIGISEEPLFEAAPAPPAPPREQRVAQSMLPETIGNWKRTGVAAFPVRPGQTQNAAESAWQLAGAAAHGFFDTLELTPEFLESYRARWVYVARYRSGGDQEDAPENDPAPSSAEAIAWLADLPDAAHAFGLCFERQRDLLAESVSSRLEGWQRKDTGRTGAWAGRYYTEVHSRAGQDALADLRDGVTASQLAYGRPFWAEQALPTEHRLDHSLRFMTDKPLGLSELPEAWIAGYDNGITMLVSDARASQRVQAIEALRSRFADGESTVELPEHVDGDVVAGRIADATVVALNAGEHLYLVTGPEPDNLWPIAESLIAGSAPRTGGTPALSGSDGATARATVVEASFAEVPGGRILAPTKIERYTDNLYAKINGKEGMFRSYLFKELRFGQYQDATAGTTFDVYIYDQGEPVNAFGIYASERSPNAQQVAIGRDAYASGASIYFCKGKYYVNVLGPEDGGEAALESATQIARAIADTITAKSEPFWAEALLPQEQRVPDSIRYLATSALGYQFLSGVFTANYEIDGTSYQLFILLAADREEAASLLDEFAKATAEYDKVVSREAYDHGETVIGDSLGYFSVVFNKGVFLGGAIECEEREVAERQAIAFREQLPLDAVGSVDRRPQNPRPKQPAVPDEESSYGY